MASHAKNDVLAGQQLSAATLGAPCKTVGSAYPGSNPGPATISLEQPLTSANTVGGCSVAPVSGGDWWRLIPQASVGARPRYAPKLILTGDWVGSPGWTQGSQVARAERRIATQ